MAWSNLGKYENEWAEVSKEQGSQGPRPVKDEAVDHEHSGAWCDAGEDALFLGDFEKR